MIEQKQNQFWNRQTIPNKSTFSDFRISSPFSVNMTISIGI